MKTSHPLKGKTALVTGGSKRIGREISLALAQAGVNVIIHYNHSEAEAQDLCDKIKSFDVKSWILKANFERSEEYETLINRAFLLSNDFAFLVNNASIFPEEDLNTVSFESLIANIQINTWAPFVLCQKFSERVKEGKIINLLDSRTEDFDWTHVGYILSKHLLTVLTKVTALKYAPNITVNGIAPGLILPPPGEAQSYIEKRVNTVPLQCHGEPSDVSEAVLYLLKTNFITGNIIYIDGGRHLGENCGQNTH